MFTEYAKAMNGKVFDERNNAELKSETDHFEYIFSNRAAKVCGKI